MGLITLAKNLIANTPENVNDLMTDLNQFVAVINGNLDGDNLATIIKSRLGISDSGVTRSGTATVATAQSTTSAGPVDLATVGPSLTITVPTPTGTGQAFIAVHVTVTFDTVGGDTSSVFLDMDGSNLGQILAHSDISPTQYWTCPGTVVGTATEVLGGWLIVMPVSPGLHTFKLRYGSGGAGCAFSNRTLSITTGTTA